MTVMNIIWFTLFSLGPYFTSLRFGNAFSTNGFSLKRINKPFEVIVDNVKHDISSGQTSFIDRKRSLPCSFSSLRATVVNEEAISKMEVESSDNISHENFDFLSHWYPVIWAHDLEIDKPTKVSIFDVDYVIAKINTKSDTTSKKDKKKKIEDEEVIAMVDRCPHRSAALSEGRITKIGKSFQCAYHGWTFDSKTGECIDIPQVDENYLSSSVSDLKEQSRSERRRNGNDLKSNGVAVPAMISQGIVWLFPGGGLEKALTAPPPPTIPEMDKEGYRHLSVAIRDFPIDWTILLENIMDADHGLFAHQTKLFDLYTASKSNPMKIVEKSLNDGKGWSITSQVDATYELLKRNEKAEQIMTNVKGKKKEMKSKYGTDDQTDKNILKSTTIFTAPNFIQLGRRDENNEANFLPVFYICPTGTGRSRFLSCLVGKAPKWLHVPQWIANIGLNDFLDQDTHLLATQQRHVLATESQLTLDMDKHDDESKMSIPVRKNLYNYRSPTEKLSVKVGKWLDATVLRVPNRSKAIRNYGGYESALQKLSVKREESLDRYTQHTLICNSSSRLVKNCQKLRKGIKILAFIPVLIRLMTFGFEPATFNKSLLSSFLFKLNNSLTPTLLSAIWGISAISYYSMAKIQKQFEFKYTEDYRNKDMDKIPSLWMDSF